MRDKADMEAEHDRGPRPTAGGRGPAALRALFRAERRKTDRPVWP